MNKVIMANMGITSSTPSISPFSISGNSFSIKNILNLSDATVEKDETNLSCSAPSLPVVPRAVFPSGYHRPYLSSYLPGFYSLPSHQPVPQKIPINNVLNSGMTQTVQKKRRRPMKNKKLRPLFSTHQIQTMEKEFEKCRYIAESRRAGLASDLNLTEMQVKTWFQNRRTKWKKETRGEKEGPSLEISIFCQKTRTDQQQDFLRPNAMSFYNADGFKSFPLF